MYRAKSEWLPSMCGAKSALLFSMCKANLQALFCGREQCRLRSDMEGVVADIVMAIISLVL